MPRELSERQRRFVEAYMGKAAGNATEAAALAGYKGSRRTLEVQGSANLRNPIVAAAIAARVKTDPLIATREERQHFWTQVMNGEIEGPRAVGKEGEIIEGPASLVERLKASELLGRSQADFIDRHEHSGTIDLGPARDSLAAKLDDIARRLAAQKEQPK